MDLSSAFDTVDHEKLPRVLPHRLIVNGLALAWFGSYLTARTPAYHQDDQQSQIYAENCSLPQGSVLGPQEFIAYMKELAELIDGVHLSHHLYANDTQLLQKNKNR
jgi:hypothetical protein